MINEAAVWFCGLREKMMMMMVVWGFISLSTLFKSYQDNKEVVMKGSMH